MQPHAIPIPKVHLLTSHLPVFILLLHLRLMPMQDLPGLRKLL
jgi:hypothetical protein